MAGQLVGVHGRGQLLLQAPPHALDGVHVLAGQFAGALAGHRARLVHDERHRFLNLAAVEQPRRRAASAVGFHLLEQHHHLGEVGKPVDAGERLLGAEGLIPVHLAQILLVKRRGEHDLDVADGRAGPAQAVPMRRVQNVPLQVRCLHRAVRDALDAASRQVVAHRDEARMPALLAEVAGEQHVGRRDGEIALGVQPEVSRGHVARHAEHAPLAFGRAHVRRARFLHLHVGEAGEEHLAHDVVVGACGSRAVPISVCANQRALLPFQRVCAPALAPGRARL